MFVPRRIIFEKGALDYSIGVDIYEKFKDHKDIEIINTAGNRIKKNIPGESIGEFYKEGKNTLVVGVKKGLKFQSCKPSAHFQLPLVSGCTGMCQYCYLNTNLGDKPYIKVNANIDDILNKAQEYINERKPEITIFEGAATSDPVPVEPYTKSLKKTIEFFSENEYGRFRFVTKYDDIDGLLDIKHNNHTEIRFTINTDYVIKNHENRTASIKNRINASFKAFKSGYPIGFIIAPVFLYEGYKEDYENLLIELKNTLGDLKDTKITFEVISHRYTTRAKNIINEVFLDNTLPMNDDERKYKYGQFGYGKYVYKNEELKDMKNFFEKSINKYFNNCEIKYII